MRRSYVREIFAFTGNQNSVCETRRAFTYEVSLEAYFHALFSLGVVVRFTFSADPRHACPFLRLRTSMNVRVRPLLSRHQFAPSLGGGC